MTYVGECPYCKADIIWIPPTKQTYECRKCGSFVTGDYVEVTKHIKDSEGQTSTPFDS